MFTQDCNSCTKYKCYLICQVIIRCDGKTPINVTKTIKWVINLNSNVYSGMMKWLRECQISIVILLNSTEREGGGGQGPCGTSATGCGQHQAKHYAGYIYIT